jgi:hypothetical protein
MTLADQSVYNAVQKDLQWAVRSAIDCGCTPAQFKQITAELWESELRERLNHQPQEFYK